MFSSILQPSLNDTSKRKEAIRFKPSSLRLQSLAVSVICIPEIVSALCRRRRERKVSTQEYRNAKASVLSDIDDATVIGITEEVLAQAVALLEQFPLRSADALHVACASEWSADLFVSADDRQCAAARAHGLRVEAIRV